MSYRETGIVMNWNEKHGLIERDSTGDILFVHVTKTIDRQPLMPGSQVSFICEKRGEAKEVAVEETVEVHMPNQKVREKGTVERWSAEKCFGFIVRVNGEQDAFFHKKHFSGDSEPYIGQAVSFVLEQGSRGPFAVNIKEEGVVGEAADEGNEEERKFRAQKDFEGIQPTDQGREFGEIKTFSVDKGFGFIVARTDSENVYFDEKDLNGVKAEKKMCISFVREEGVEGSRAKGIREEDPDRVARVTAKVHYGKVVNYYPTPGDKSGFGFIVGLDQLNVKGGKRHYFHQSEIVNPDEFEDLGAMVSFIILPAKKGTQAAAVTVVDPSTKEKLPTRRKMHKGKTNENENTTKSTSEWGWEMP